MKYHIEIYHPDNLDDVLTTFESDSPFMNISKGDILNTRTWENAYLPDKVLVVHNMEHYIWENNGIAKHKIAIYTRAVEDTENIRIE